MGAEQGAGGCPERIDCGGCLSVEAIAAERLSLQTVEMAISDCGKAPPEHQIGSRIRVRRDRADEAARRFAANGFDPIYVEHRADGDVSFWFGKAGEEETQRIIASIPREFFALRAVIAGSSTTGSPVPGASGRGGVK